jgi:uncharacterized protein
MGPEFQKKERPCSECRLCCKLFPVPLLQKPAGAWCRHSCAAGCAIHSDNAAKEANSAEGDSPVLADPRAGTVPSRQPEVCRQYDCYWRDHDELPEQWRPDRIRVVVTEAGTVMVGTRFLPVVTFQEDFADAARGAMAAAMLDRFVQQGFAVLVICGLESRLEFDHARYPDISDEAIEAALRYELSQDADELRRLGAVE